MPRSLSHEYPRFRGPTPNNMAKPPNGRRWSSKLDGADDRPRCALNHQTNSLRDTLVASNPPEARRLACIFPPLNEVLPSIHQRSYFVFFKGRDFHRHSQRIGRTSGVNGGRAGPAPTNTPRASLSNLAISSAELVGMGHEFLKKNVQPGFNAVASEPTYAPMENTTCVSTP